MALESQADEAGIAVAVYAVGATGGTVPSVAEGTGTNGHDASSDDRGAIGPVAAPPAHQEAVLAVCAWCDDYARGFYAHRWRPVPAALVREAKRLRLTTDGICDRCRPRVAPELVGRRPCCGAHAYLTALLKAGAAQEREPTDATV